VTDPSVAIIHPDGRFIFAGQTYRCALGRAGVAPYKQEGDHHTPSGLLPLRRVLYRADRVAPPKTLLPREPIAPNDGWCDDANHAAYNTQVKLPFDGRHEYLWRGEDIYDVIGVLGWNDAPVLRGQGSAIFLHIARRDFAPTAGCIALPRQDLLRVLAEGLTALHVLSA